MAVTGFKEDARLFFRVAVPFSAAISRAARAEHAFSAARQHLLLSRLLLTLVVSVVSV